MFTQRKAHSKGFWEHSFTSEGQKKERERLFAPFQHATSVCDLCVISVGPTFAGHHGSRLEALLARALEAPDHVGAGSVSTRVPDGALIRV